MINILALTNLNSIYINLLYFKIVSDKITKRNKMKTKIKIFKVVLQGNQNVLNIQNIQMNSIKNFVLN